MPAIATIEFLPDATGAVLIFARYQPPDPALDAARLVRPGETFLGLSSEQLVAAGTRRIVPDERGGAWIEAVRTTGRPSSAPGGP